MNASVTAADAAACSSRSFEVQVLAGRVEACAAQLEDVLLRLSRLQLSDWQSPAGRAYRESAGLQAAALRRAGEQMDSAAGSVRRHANNVPLSPPWTAAGGF
jgi:hypothetical protein